MEIVNRIENLEFTQNDYRIEGDVSYIILAGGQEAILDTCDLFRVLGTGRWQQSSLRGHTYYSEAKINYKFVGQMHRVVMQAQDGTIIDHKNGNGLDNRKSNLRYVTHAQNMQNVSRANKNNVLGIRNIIKIEQRYCVQIKNDLGKKIKKSFKTLEEATKAAIEMRKQHQSHCAENSRIPESPKFASA